MNILHREENLSKAQQADSVNVSKRYTQERVIRATMSMASSLVVIRTSSVIAQTQPSLDDASRLPYCYERKRLTHIIYILVCQVRCFG